MTKFPTLFTNPEDCCGCSACYATCPVDAIIMQQDQEGFYYPAIDEKKCMKCYKCLSVCCFNRDNKA